MAPARCEVEVQVFWKDKSNFKPCGKYAGFGPGKRFCEKHAPGVEKLFAKLWIEGEEE
jgi:hypothetical protein